MSCSKPSTIRVPSSIWSNGRGSGSPIFVPLYTFRANDLEKFRMGFRVEASTDTTNLILQRGFQTADDVAGLAAATPATLGTSFAASNGDHYVTAYEVVSGLTSVEQWVALGVFAWNTSGTARKMAQLTLMLDTVSNG